ncbi:hypothetical protein C0J52_26841, partial [Blattella germanica]
IRKSEEFLLQKTSGRDFSSIATAALDNRFSSPLMNWFVFVRSQVSATVIAVLLIVGNVEINPGPNYNDNDSGLKNIESTLTKLVNAITDLTTENKITNCVIRQNKEDITQMKKEIQLTNKEIRRQDKTNRLNNLVLYGVQERGHERNIDTYYIICDIFANYFGFQLHEYHFNNVFRIGKGNNRPILIIFNSYITKQQIFDRSARLKGSNYKLDNDYDYNTRQIRKKLLPFMHEARGKGYRANIINDKLKINGKIYDLDYLENEFRNAENVEQSHNRRHSFRARSNSPIRRQVEEIEQLTTRTSTNEGIENSRESRCEERRSRDTKKPNHSNEHGMSASAVEFRPSTRRKSKSPDGPKRDVEGTAVTRLRSGRVPLVFDVIPKGAVNFKNTVKPPLN